MYYGGGVNESLRTAIRIFSEQLRSARERKFWMIADQKRFDRLCRCRELSRDYRPGPRRQSCGQVLLVFDEYKIGRPCRLNAGHVADLNAAIADQAGPHGVTNVLQRARHGSHCIAPLEKKKAGRNKSQARGWPMWSSRCSYHCPGTSQKSRSGSRNSDRLARHSNSTSP